MEGVMARKEMISKDDILNFAFQMTMEQGHREVTARKLAAFAGCSTQPIFRNYQNMEDCLKSVFLKTLDHFDSFYLTYDKGSRIPFVNLGLVYIAYAQKFPKLFQYLFMEKNNQGLNLYSLLNGRTGAVMKEMNMAKEMGAPNPETIFMKMWMLIHGAACMTITGDYDLSMAETRMQLEDAYKSFV